MAPERSKTTKKVEEAPPVQDVVKKKRGPPAAAVGGAKKGEYSEKILEAIRKLGQQPSLILSKLKPQEMVEYGATKPKKLRKKARSVSKKKVTKKAPNKKITKRIMIVENFNGGGPPYNGF